MQDERTGAISADKPRRLPLAERVYRIVGRDAGSGEHTAIDVRWSRPVLDRDPTEAEGDLRDWGFAFGVAFALARVIPGVTFERGLALANRIHNSGRAVVWTGHREPAELYWTELEALGLTMAPLER